MQSNPHGTGDSLKIIKKLIRRNRILRILSVLEFSEVFLNQGQVFLQGLF
jgi:hypothetical protein